MRISYWSSDVCSSDLEFLQELHKTGPAAQVGWSLGEAWDYFLRGKSVFVYSWGDVGALVQDTSRSKIQGRMGASILLVSNEYWDFERSEEHTSELQSLMRISYDVFCLKKKKK